MLFLPNSAKQHQTGSVSCATTNCPTPALSQTLASRSTAKNAATWQTNYMRRKWPKNIKKPSIECDIIYSCDFYLFFLMERGDQGRGRREEEKGYEIIQPQHRLLLIVCMYSAGTSASWPVIMPPISQIHQFYFCIVCQRSPLLSWCIPSVNLKTRGLL